MAPAALVLRTLGSLSLDGLEPEQQLAVVSGEKRVGFLLYLLLAGRGGFVRRDTLLALLWPDADEQHARGALRALIHQLRGALGSDVILSRGDQELAVNLGRIRCDVLDFETACRADDWESALDSYRGYLLEGFAVAGAREFAEWLDGQRRRLQDVGRALAWRVAQRARDAANPAREIAVLQRLLVWAPYDEPAVRSLMEALDLSGDRAGALELFARFSDRLLTDLEATPSPETKDFAETLRARTEARPLIPRDVLVVTMPPKARRRALSLAVLVALSGAFVVGSGSGRDSHPRTAIAVMPFRNLSQGSTNAYFAEALHGEVLTQLSRVRGLSVRGRTSVRGYEHADKSYRDIAHELGVGALLEANVQVIDRRVRLNVILIDAATGQSIWAEGYAGSLDDAFAIQSAIAQRIVHAVGARLAEPERAAITQPPTADAEAYLFYLQARAYFFRPGYLRQNWSIAQQLYERAIARDSNFALAHAGLSELHGGVYWFRYDPNAERLIKQREAAEAALRLAPELPQAHVAMGLVYYWGQRDYGRALDELAIALRGLPNDARLWELQGFVHRRLGNWDAAFASLERATQLDPRNADVVWNLGGLTYALLHRYKEAVDASNRALALAPDLQNVMVRNGWNYVAWLGQLDTLRAALGRISDDAELAELGTAAAQHARLLLWARQPDSLSRLLATVRSPVFEGQEFFLPISLYAAWAHVLKRDRTAARAAFDATRMVLDLAVREHPDDYRIHASRGLALAGLRHWDEARREAAWLSQSVVYREDANAGTILAEDRARILAQIGDSDSAIAQIERLLARPSYLSVHSLRLDPLWDPIRHHPRFQALAGSLP